MGLVHFNQVLISIKLQIGTHVTKSKKRKPFVLRKFLYTKSQTLHKNLDNLHYLFIYKNPDTLRYAIFHRIFEIGGGGGGYAKNNTICITLLFAKKYVLYVTF